MKDYDIEAMQEVLSEYGIEVSFDRSRKIAEDFITCYENNREYESLPPSFNKESDFERAERLQKELNKATRLYNKTKADSEVYEKYIRNRLGASHIEVENGRIYFER